MSRTISVWHGALVALVLAVGALVPIAAPTTAAAGDCIAPPIGTPLGTVAGGFVGVTPTRVLDTRTGVGAPAQPVGADCVAHVPLAAVVPASASGVAATVTVVDAAAIGFVTAYPCGSPRPYVSNVNTRTDSPVPNLVLAPVDSTRLLCIYSSVTANILVDITGYFAPTGAQFHDVTPARVLDTRDTTGDFPLPPLPAGTIVQVDLTGHGVPNTASGADVNITITQPQGVGYATAYPCGTDVPEASNVNFLPGEDRAAQAMVAVNKGFLCIYVAAPAHVVVDLWGWFGGADGADIVTPAASRLVDSRVGTGGWSTPLAAGEVRGFSVPQVAGGIRTSMLDVVAAGAAGSGYLTLFPCDSPQPPTSSVNFDATGPAMNLVTAALSVDSRVCVFASVATDVVIDLFAYTDNPGPLRSLSLSPQALTTAFTPGGRDYAIPCAAGSNVVTVNATALPGYTITVGFVSNAPRLTTSVVVTPNALVQIDLAQNGVAVDHYYVRCLPPDFPAISSLRLGRVAPGWYLVTPGLVAPISHYAIILDERGVPLWYEKAPTSILDLKRLPTGALAWVPTLGIGYGTNPSGAYEIHSVTTGLVTQTVHSVGFPTDQHDMVALPNGHFVVMSYEKITGVDLTALGTNPTTHVPFTTNETVVRGVIQELDSNGNVVFQWRAADHIALTESRHPLSGLELPDTTVVDIDHFNSVDVTAEGDYIVSARHLDAVLRINHLTGAIDWKLGGTPTAASLTIGGDPLGGPKGMHDARLQADGSVTMFDNELGTANATRAVRYALDLGARTATLVRSYARPDNANIATMGSVRVTSDDHLVIGWGANGPLVTELDAANNVVLEIDGPSGGNYRAVREPAASFNRDTLRASSPG